MSKTTGTKGSDVFDSTGSPLLDLSVSLVRGAQETSISKGIQTIVSKQDRQMNIYLLVLLFHVRNIRGGKGERDLFLSMYSSLYTYFPTQMVSLLKFVPTFGSWHDLCSLYTRIYSSLFHKAILTMFATQLQEDVGKPDTELSLCAKWAPREGKTHHAMANALSKFMFPNHRNHLQMYRQLVSSINRRLKTVETLMSGRMFSAIVPKNVPGRAGKLYTRAFLNLASTFKEGSLVKLSPAESRKLRYPDNLDRMDCREHFQEHFQKASEGTAKIHGSATLFPHEVVKKAMSESLTDEEKNQLNAIWRTMVERQRRAAA